MKMVNMNNPNYSIYRSLNYRHWDFFNDSVTPFAVSGILQYYPLNTHVTVSTQSDEKPPLPKD